MATLSRAGFEWSVGGLCPRGWSVGVQGVSWWCGYTLTCVVCGWSVSMWVVCGCAGCELVAWLHSQVQVLSDGVYVGGLWVFRV